MEKKSIPGRAESPRWRKEATLRDILDLLDDIEGLKIHPEEKAKLRQRVIDYGQHLSEEIYRGKRKVPASDDNATIKEFNIRMYSTYDTKGESSYEEAREPTGYYDNKGKFIANPKSVPLDEPHGALNPRWHPIPLKETPGPIPVPVYPDDKPVVLEDTTASGKRKGCLPRAWWLVPLILGTAALTFQKCSSGAEPLADNNEDNKDKTEIKSDTNTLTPAEQEFLRYTVEKGQRMVAKQFGVSVDEGAEIYDQFVENIRKGKVPESLKDLTKKYKMSRMIDSDLDIDLDRPEIAATTWMLMSESYPAIREAVHQAITNPEKEVSAKSEMKLTKYLSFANDAAKKYNVDSENNQVSTVDYGLYGANRKTGWAISFRKKAGDKKTYDGIAYHALQEGKNY